MPPRHRIQGTLTRGPGPRRFGGLRSRHTLTPVVVFIQKPIHPIADPPAHGIKARSDLWPPTTTTARTGAGDTIHQLPPGFNPLIKPRIQWLSTTLAALSTCIHLQTLPTSVLQPAFPLQADQSDGHTADLQNPEKQIHERQLSSGAGT